MNFKKLFKSLDLLGPDVTLYSQSYPTLKSNLGAVLTLIIGTFSILCFIGLGMDMLFKMNPSLYEYRVFNLTSEIELEKMPFAIGLMKPGGGVIKDLKRKVRIYFKFAITNSSNVNQPTQYKIFDLSYCNEVKLFKQNLNQIKSKIIGEDDRFFCLPDDFKESIVGQFGNPFFKLAQIYIDYCKNSTEEKTCLPLETIKTDLSVFYAQYLYMDYYSDLTDYRNPLKPYWRSNLIQLSSSSYRTDEYTYKIMNVLTDEGLIMESTSIMPSFQFDSKIGLVYGPDKETILTLITDISNLNFFSGRKYMKLQLVIANTGGLIKFLTMLASFILSYLNQYFFIETIFLNSMSKYNKLCQDKPEFSNDKSDVKMIEIHNNYIETNPNPKIKLDIGNSPPMNTITVEKEGKNLNYEKLNYRKINLCSPLCYKSNSMSFINKLNRYYMKEMDLFNFFLLIHNNKLMENIIFDEKSKRAKDYIYHINLINFMKDQVTSFKQDPMQFPTDADSFFRDILHIKNTEKIININESLYQEFVKLKAF